MDFLGDEFASEEVDGFIYKEFINEDYNCEIHDDKDADIMVMMSILEEIEKKEEDQVFNFKGSIRGRIVSCDRIKGAWDIYNDYFKYDSVLHE